MKIVQEQLFWPTISIIFVEVSDIPQIFILRWLYFLVIPNLNYNGNRIVRSSESEIRFYEVDILKILIIEINKFEHQLSLA